MSGGPSDCIGSELGCSDEPSVRVAESLQSVTMVAATAEICGTDEVIVQRGWGEQNENGE